MKRRRYDTQSLVQDIQKGRQRSLLISLGGLGAVLMAITVYAISMGGDEAPEPAKPVKKTETAAEAPKVTDAEQQAEDAPKPEAADAAPSKPASLALERPRNVRVWVNNKPVGKQASMELPPGEHSVRAKIGKRTLRVDFTFEAGKSYALDIDAKRKRLSVVTR